MIGGDCSADEEPLRLFFAWFALDSRKREHQITLVLTLWAFVVFDLVICLPFRYFLDFFRFDLTHKFMAEITSDFDPDVAVARQFGWSVYSLYWLFVSEDANESCGLEVDVS